MNNKRRGNVAAAVRSAQTLPALFLLLSLTLLGACPAQQEQADAQAGSRSTAGEVAGNPTGEVLSAEQIAGLPPAEAFRRLEQLGGNLDCDKFISSCAAGDAQKVLLYLRAGGGVDCRQAVPENSSGLIAAATQGHAEVVRILLEHGADTELLDPETDCTALCQALRNEHSDCAVLLMDAGANLRHSDRASFTPLHWAAATGNLEMVKELIRRGVEPDLPSLKTEINEGGITPLLRAALGGHHEVVRYLVEEQQADVNHVGGNGGTPLMAALHLQNIETARYLAEHGARPDGYFNHNWSILAIAAQIGYDEGMRWLVTEQGVDVNVRNQQDGRTALIVASQELHSKSVALLLELGADPQIKDKDGKTALDYAEANADKPTIEVLRSVNADSSI